jgi:hypothetical protein
MDKFTEKFSMNIEEFLEGGMVYKPGTLVLTLTGPEANKASYSLLSKILIEKCGAGLNGVTSIYREETHNKFFALLSAAAHVKIYNKLHGRKIENDKPRFSLLIEHKDKERTKGTISYVPNTARPEAVQKLAAQITGDSETEVCKIKAAQDKWTFLCKPQKEIPHYVEIDLSGKGNYHTKVCVTLPGRKPPCSVCQGVDHWTNKCPKRANKLSQKPGIKPRSSQFMEKEPKSQTVVSNMDQALTGQIMSPNENTDKVVETVEPVRATNNSQETDSDGFRKGNHGKKKRRRQESPLEKTSERLTNNVQEDVSLVNALKKTTITDDKTSTNNKEDATWEDMAANDFGFDPNNSPAVYVEVASDCLNDEEQC